MSNEESIDTTGPDKELLGRWNGRDADALVAAFAKDGTFCNPDTYPGISGKAGVNPRSPSRLKPNIRRKAKVNPALSLEAKSIRR